MRQSIMPLTDELGNIDYVVEMLNVNILDLLNSNWTVGFHAHDVGYRRSGEV